MERSKYAWEELAADDPAREGHMAGCLWVALRNSAGLLSVKVAEFKRVNHETHVTLEACDPFASDLFYGLSKKALETEIFVSEDDTLKRIVCALRKHIPDEMIAAFINTLNSSPPK